MSYTIERANLLANQLRRFSTSYKHHLVGQFVNVDFWLSETVEVLKAIDGYYHRYNNLRKAQKEWVMTHGTKVYDYCSQCGGKCEFSDGTPSPPVKIPKDELESARRLVKDAAYHFLLRCYRAGLLDENNLGIMCEQIGTSVEPADLLSKK
jgi:hypothetical protein